MLEKKQRKVNADELKKETDEKRKACFEKARRTGKRVKLYSYSDDCNNNDEDCDLDIITVYAMPDGSTEEERSHTY